MSERAPCHIILGGDLAADLHGALVGAIQTHNLSHEWDGETFAGPIGTSDAPLELFGMQLPGGIPFELEEFCRDHQLAYWRWSASCYGAFNAEIEVHLGDGSSENVEANDSEIPVFCPQDIEAAESLDTLKARIGFVTQPIPPLRLIASTAPASEISP